MATPPTEAPSRLFALLEMTMVPLSGGSRPWGAPRVIAAIDMGHPINFYGFTAVFPWFAMARNWISIFAHLVFGVLAAFAYHELAASQR